MKVLFAAPEDAWGGILGHFRTALPDVEFIAGGLNPADLSGYDVVIPTMSRIDQACIETADQLRLIQQIGAGLEGVDLDAARARQIAVANVPTDVSGNADSVSEMALYFMLALMRRTSEHAAQREARQLGLPVGRSLHGATVGIVGFGAIGQAICRRLDGFGARCLALKTRVDQALVERHGLAGMGTLADLPWLLAESDIVVLAVPDTEATHQMMNRNSLAQMKPGSYLINIGRGGLVSRDALHEALHSGHLAGAGLDVFWEEPPDPADPLFQLNVLTSPHVAGLTDRSVTGIMQVAADNISALSNDEPLLYRKV
ncbi:MAG: 2-hydroxyacid dehydrogenase [Natronospirillum sp.]|uniref:2-hydroxyacid dehydrogenase n=1 Tax=Natronospirillum sp. TaxID=2812955 RepID=UPI0025EE272C|nr:2-hydroxyacid dehydrogenase [Natronospirillum sp.]MCH8551249.1 2-hydroxyacid dehydrogenase [Natronospirillum sp.]